MAQQLSLLSLLPQKPCEHKSCFVTMAYVPAGLVCSDCGKLLLQYIPKSPEELGYMSADWAWHYKHGKPWTTQEVLSF
jgi:hypothetical protein